MGNPIPIVPPPSWENPPGEDCPFCDESAAPLYITVTLEGFLYCEDCYYNPEDGYSWGWITWVDLNDDYVLTQVEDLPCRWYYESAVIFSYGRKFNSEDCTGEPTSDYYFAGCTFLVYRTINTVTVDFNILFDESYWEDFFGAACTEFSDCVTVDGCPNGDYDEFECDESYYKWALVDFATASIREGRAI